MANVSIGRRDTVKEGIPQRRKEILGDFDLNFSY